MRLFVAVWPPQELRRRLAALGRPALPGVSWTSAEQWHVTLRFLGEVAPEAVSALDADLLACAGGACPCVASAGPTVRRLGRHLLVVPVAGLDPLARAVGAATAHEYPMAVVGRHGDSRGGVEAWSGHLTLARARRPLAAASVPAGEVAWEWTVERIALVASTLDPAGARYCDLAVYHLGG